MPASLQRGDLTVIRVRRTVGEAAEPRDPDRSIRLDIIV
jgi:hypothetical protein